MTKEIKYEDARDFFDSYGWHLTTRREGDVTLDAVEYDWLDSDNDAAVEKLRETYDGLSQDEANEIVEKAREVRETGEEIESLLIEAIDCHLNGDTDGAMKALDTAASVESTHGDTRASDYVRKQIASTVSIIESSDDEQGEQS